MSLDAGTRAAILAAGHDPDRIGAALERLLNPSRATHLDRPATVGDGILALTPSEAQAAEQTYAAAADAGRVSCFVPASGAASRPACPSSTTPMPPRSASSRTAATAGPGWST